MHSIKIQTEFQPYFHRIEGNKDYQQYKHILERIDLLLREGGLEQKAVELKMQTTDLKLSSQERMNCQKRIIKALRCNIIKELTGLSFRELSVRLSDSLLFQRFCNLLTLDKISVPSKSTLENYSKLFNKEDYRALVSLMVKKAHAIQEDGRNSFMPVSFHGIVVSE